MRAGQHEQARQRLGWRIGDVRRRPPQLLQSEVGRRKRVRRIRRDRRLDRLVLRDALGRSHDLHPARVESRLDAIQLAERIVAVLLLPESPRTWDRRPSRIRCGCRRRRSSARSRAPRRSHRHWRRRTDCPQARCHRHSAAGSRRSDARRPARARRTGRRTVPDRLDRRAGSAAGRAGRCRPSGRTASDRDRSGSRRRCGCRAAAALRRPALAASARRRSETRAA